MAARRGWGLLLAVCTPLLIYAGWSQLQSQNARANLARYATWSASEAGTLIGPLMQYYLRNRKVATPDDVALPPLPKNMGVKAWSIDNDSSLRVELDAKVEGHPVVLRYVPVIRSADGVFYDCVSTTDAIHVGKFCQADVLRSVADIPAQLEANARVISELPPIVDATGEPLAAGVAAGSVVVAPQDAADLNKCGFQCVKPQSCVAPRAVACARTVDEGNSRWLEIAATGEDFRGGSFATRTEADQACAQSLGADFRVLVASSIGGVFKLAGGREYWVHNDLRAQANCWQTDYR